MAFSNRLNLLIQKGILERKGDRILYRTNGEATEIFRLEGEKLICTFFEEDFEYIPKHETARRKQLFTAGPDEHLSFIGLTNAYEKKVGGHTYAFFKNGTEDIEQAHFTKRHPSWFNGTRADYGETLFLMCKGMVAERVYSGFESGGFGFDNGIILPCAKKLVEHYEIDLFLDALAQNLPFYQRPNYNAPSALRLGRNCVKYQTDAFEELGIPMKSTFNIKPFTMSPYHLAQRLSREPHISIKPFLKIGIEGHEDTEINFFSTFSRPHLPHDHRPHIPFIYFNTRNLERANFPDAGYNISPDMILGILCENNPGFLKKFLKGEPLGNITVSREQIESYHDRIIKPGNTDHAKLPYILDHTQHKLQTHLPGARPR